MADVIRIIKIDPAKRLIAQLAIPRGIRGVRSVIGYAKPGHRTLLKEINGSKLIVAARVEQPPEKKHAEWRLRGCENTVGIGILFGAFQTEGGDRMDHCPVDVAWVTQNIVWCEPGENAPAAEISEVHGIPLEQGEKIAAAEANPGLPAGLGTPVSDDAAQ